MRWAKLGVVALALAAVGATADVSPKVESATPGFGGGSIERFTFIFSEPMVPLGDPRAAPPVTSACPVGGQGRWIDARSFVWDYARPLPGGVSCRFTLVDGLKSARGAGIGGERSFLADAGGPTARAVLAGQIGGEIEEGAAFLVAASLAPDPASVAREAYCAVDGIGEKIPVDLLPPGTAGEVLGELDPDGWEVGNFLDEAGLPKPLPKAGAARTRALAGVVALKCRRPLPPGRDMALVWPASIAAPGGKLAGAERRFDFTVRKAFEARFECARVNPRAGCNPVQPAYVRFTAPIPRAQAEALRIEVGGRTLTPRIEDKGAQVSSVTFDKPLPSAATGQLSLPADLRDLSGRPLANARRFPLEVRFDAAPPLVKFAADFGILEAKEGGVLPVTVRAVEPALAGHIAGIGGGALKVEGGDGAVAAWLRRIDKAAENDWRDEKRGGESVTVNMTGAASILAGEGRAKPLNLALPGKGKDFEVVGVPLGKPGFYVVELASPALGRALLGRDAPRYVAAGALVTNMAVHFKWGRASSLAWVTSLDGGKPVAGAAITVSDSCTGAALAEGRTDAQGRLLVAKPLGDPSTYGSCDENSENHPLMISARAAGDYSFTMSKWADGIAPTDFELPFGWSEQGPIVHTVFDRTLIRQGESVAMKQILRRPVATGFAAEGFAGLLRLTHRGSDTEFDVPLAIGRDGVGETRWTAPKGAPLGDYDLAVIAGDTRIDTGQSLRVDEYRLPTMRAAVSGPKAAQVRPKAVPLDLFVGYLSGGGAANLPVAVRAAFSADERAPKGWDGWSFGGRRVKPGVTPLDGDNNEVTAPWPPAQTLPVTLDRQGAARTSIEVPAAIDGPAVMAVEMDYQDANGETLTAASNITLHTAAVRIGLKTDGWMMKDDDLRLKLVALDPEGRPIKGQRIKVALYSREILSARRRLIGGFYAYDNNARVTELDAICSATTDAQGLASCALDPGVSGEVYAVATAQDDEGRETRATTSVWLAGEDEWWFGGDNGDRMDLIPEARDYAAGATARLQVRMPFRSATALVTVEREGVLSSFVTQLSGKDPVVEVPLAGTYAPDVYVSVLAVRGRIGGWRLWLADFARRWHLPFFSREGAAPTALVDLAKPSYRLGLAKLNVGWEAHRLDVQVKADRAAYHVRETAQVAVQVTAPGKVPPKSAEIAFAAVDEAILQLAPNDSWKLIDAMMGERPLSVVTSTAAMQVVGKRHYGRKALAAGGGGGDLGAVNREDFRPVLLWRGRVPLDAAGRARVAVPLSDSLSAFRLVAIATAGSDRFGTGEAVIRTVQDLAIYPGLPPLVREGDRYAAGFTLRNGSNRAMTVTATAETSPRIGRAPPLTVTIPAGGAVPVNWHLTAPAGIGRVAWTVNARASGGAADRLTAAQEIVPAIPVETWAATLLRVGEGGSLPIAAPTGALPGRGGVEVRLTAALEPPLAGVRAYMVAYPYSCLEQRASRAVALGDAAMWGRVAGDLPAYFDGDGLLRYWPVDGAEGSEALTAYILSIASEAGLPLPESARARMVQALAGVVDGRIAHDGPGGGERRLLKLAALGALARAGAANAGMFGQIGLAARDMPTSALTDWIVALDRTPGADPAAKAEALSVLRGRLVYEGSRLDLVDQGAAPWWMMVSGDEMAARALLVALGRQGFASEAPRMMVGLSLRQRRGHWDTTPANAWGAIAARRFAAAFPAAAVAGTTTLQLGSSTQTRGWPLANPLVRLPLPRAPSPLLLSQAGGAGPWAQVVVKAAVPLTAPLSAGYRIARTVTPIVQKVPGRLTRGDVLRVRLTVDAGAERNWVVVDDPIPAGATIVGGLGGQSAQMAEAASGGEGVSPAYVERAQDAWRGYWSWVPRGRFVAEYAVRLNGVGTFQLPPTRVEAMYSPDIRAAIPNRPVTVAAR
ncbi:alpha-2-macroglobulin family protein [Sphingomonas jatrophae]|uniref:Alpha-2-macroglobulin n=1 Tax=Sphingomonas jatrophae TaxID=1166337 RepID=A0A1I6LPR3_9SPHN|nr:alpha-2-macroglobulin family protein [Sphingomonas jatrophae]SFS05421.1 hypothetical protein SAMN05192580_3095 [Sphingomonas jatrophae]